MVHHYFATISEVGGTFNTCSLVTNIIASGNGVELAIMEWYVHVLSCVSIASSD